MYNFLHLELTSRCNKTCKFCGRRKLEKTRPELCDWGDMPLEMVCQIARQVPDGTVVQFHNNGDPLVYPPLAEALAMFPRTINQFNTNAKALLDQPDEVWHNLDILTISVIEDDPEGDDQFETVRKFLEVQGSSAPRMIYRLLGDVKDPERWRSLPGLVVTRSLHWPERSAGYESPAPIPETGICVDLLTHLAIDRRGNISMCVRMDPEKELFLGNINKITLEEAWNGSKRRYYVREHVKGNRSHLSGCNKCQFWGCPNPHKTT